MVLFVNACVRGESRTRRLAECLIAGWDEPAVEVALSGMTFPEVDEAFLRERERLAAAGEFEAPLLAPAVQFASADRIVIAAPYWDLSFPATLKRYLEQINVTGVTFTYTPEGVPQGLCRARQLFYVTTAGGGFVPEEFGFGYVKALAQNFYGIPDVRLIMAKGLDLDGADPERILGECMEEIRRACPK